MRLAPIALTALALTLAACEGGGDPVEQALRDAASKNHAARVQEGVVSAPAHTGAHGTGTTTPGDAAFAASEAAMHTGMTRASGQTVDEAYIAKMIEHHRGAVAMAEVALRESRDPEVRRMAQVVIDTQTRETAEMQAWKPAPAN